MTRQFETITGYFLTVGPRAFFLETQATKRTAKTAREMITAIGHCRGFCPELIERIKADPETVTRIQKDMNAATLTKKYTDGVGVWYSISGRYFGGGYSPDEVQIYRHIVKRGCK